jgi:transglutaminase-like putative cysteine protease
MASVAQSNRAPVSLGGPSAVQRYFETSLFLLVTTGAISIVSTGKLDIFTTLAVPIAIAYKAFRHWRGRGPELSSRVATWMVLGYFLVFPIDLWVFSRMRAQGAPNPLLYAALLAAIHLLLFAIIIRLYSARTNRDYGFLATLAVASMLASAILTVETGFLIALTIFLALAVSTFVAMEIRRAGADAVSPTLDPGTPLAGQLNRALSVVSLLVALAALIVGTAIFFLIPRFTTGYMSAFNIQPTLVTGFSENMTLGTIGQIQQSPNVVMRVQVDGDPARAADIHWRGIALTNFDGKSWFTEARGQNIVLPGPDGVFGFASPPFPAGESQQIHYTVMMEPMDSSAIFVAPRIQALRGNFLEDVTRTGAGSRRNYLLMDQTGSIFNSERTGVELRYEGVSNVPAIPQDELRKADQDYPNQISRFYLQLPATLDPRIKQLTEEVTQHAHSPYDKAISLELYLKSHYAYTLDLSEDPGSDPLSYFLFQRKAGHCEYFASAMAIMLREIGIPSRYATGFLPGEYNDVGKDYIIRASDAHAWVEAYFPKYGWVTFDPTPGGEVRRPTGAFERMQLYWDWFQLSWSEWVVNYDFGHQIRLGENTQRATRDITARSSEWYREKRDAAVQALLRMDEHVEKSRYTLPALLVFLIGLLFWLRGRAIITYAVARWNLGARRGGNLTPSLAIFEYQEMLKMLEKHGWKKSPSQTAREFAAALPASEFSGHVAQLTEIYHDARFGSHPAPAEHASALLRKIREFLHSPKQSTR